MLFRTTFTKPNPASLQEYDVVEAVVGVEYDDEGRPQEIELSPRTSSHRMTKQDDTTLVTTLAASTKVKAETKSREYWVNEGFDLADFDFAIVGIDEDGDEVIL